MGNEISIAQGGESGHEPSQAASTLTNGVDPPESETADCSRAKDSDSMIDQDCIANKRNTSASVATEKVRNVRPSKKHGARSATAGHGFSTRQYSPEPVLRSASHVYSGQSELTPQAEAAIVQKLKEKAYKSILLHASAIGRNAVLDLSYSASVEPCGLDGAGQRVLVTARGTPTVIVQEISMASQNAHHHPLPPMIIPAY